MSVTRRGPSRTRAQSIVEFALVLPLFALLLFGFIDFARLEYSYISLANAAREMARVAAISANSDDKVVDSFNNYATMASDWGGNASVPPTDTVTMTVHDRSGNTTAPATCTLTSNHGSPTVRGLMHSSSPDPDACPVTSRSGKAGGYVDIVAKYQFTFNPLFQNRLTGMIDASFLQQFATLSTTARAYIE